jgi:hypothetical protein
MLSSYILLGALQNFLQQRDVAVQSLTAEQMVPLMLDFYRLVPVDTLEGNSIADALIYRYGGWSEGCATGFRLSVLRRVTEPTADGRNTDWYAGITLMFEPSRYAALSPFDTVSTDWSSVDAFLRAIESTEAFKLLAAATPMSAMLESGGLR